MNIFIHIKRFMMNKNTVTIIGVILVIAILYLGYSWQVDLAITKIKNIPIAKETIQPREQITRDKIDYVDAVPAVLGGEVIRKASDVIDKYAAHNTMIPAGSLFYKSTVKTLADMPDSAFVNLKDGEVPYSFSVDMGTTYANTIMPGNYIDIYMKAKDENGLITVGKLVENVEVLAVKDSNGKNVFENTSEDRIPRYLMFGVTSEINILMRKANYMSEYSVVLFPVPHGGSSDVVPGEIIVSTEYLRNFINTHTVVIGDIEGSEEDLKLAKNEPECKAKGGCWADNVCGICPVEG